MIKLLHTENVYYLFNFLDLLLVLCFLTINGTLCMIWLVLDLLNEVSNPLPQHFQILNRFLLSLFVPLFDNYLKKIQKVL